MARGIADRKTATARIAMLERAVRDLEAERAARLDILDARVAAHGRKIAKLRA